MLLSRRLKFTNFDLKVDFKADSYSLDPMSVCMQPGSFSIDLGVESIEVRGKGGWAGRGGGRKRRGTDRGVE